MNKARRYRPSQLNTNSVVTPAVPEVPETPENGVQDASAMGKLPQQAPGNEKPAGTKKPKRERRVYYMDHDKHARAEAAYAFTAGHTRLRSWTAFVEAAIEEQTRVLEAKYNDSRPFPELGD